MPPLTSEEIHEAEAALRGIIHRTPVEFSRSLSELAGVEVWLKCENLQVGGSFKIRGAYTRMVRLPATARAAGVIAASAGNHAQGVALAARELGIPAIVYMPEGAALPKVAATRDYGATVRLVGSTVDEALEAATAEAAATGRTIVHPFDHRDVVLGQATLGTEILDQVPGARHVLVPAGGGGLLAGIGAAVATGSGPRPQVVGVQAVGAAALPESLAQGRPVPLSAMETMADGIAVGCPGAVPLDFISRTVDGIMTVTEEELSRALLLLTERAKLVVEPAGTAGVAAALRGAGNWSGPIVAVLSGGNIDPLVLTRILRHGLVDARRYLHLRIRARDTPGHLARLLAQVASSGANVLSVDHNRTAPSLAMGEVEIAIEAETRGPDHARAVIDGVRAEAGIAGEVRTDQF
ncbi:threonine ammonia-lyase [Pseudactinotalea sp. HY158]|uniref:threonine ammonia-lyase n=1 Tax=Pseudactinotalea sp. HY158 TaxID=2654547 RepID=UPI001E2F706F|nr:threonine ammonia-lyase [Pseudactinotalea sp. HY158]